MKQLVTAPGYAFAEIDKTLPTTQLEEVCPVRLINRSSNLRLITASVMFGSSLLATAASSATIDVFRDPNCGCCTKWIKYLESSGYQVIDHVQSDMHAFKQAQGVPDRLSSCHTAIIGGKFIEGHVPVEQIAVLEQRLDLLGVAAHGIPMGSPGMERGGMRDAYQIVGLTRQGNDEVVANYEAR